MHVFLSIIFIRSLDNLKAQNVQYPKCHVSTISLFLTSQSTNSWAGRMAQVVECLPNKHKALNSNPTTTKFLQIPSVINHKILPNYRQRLFVIKAKLGRK
jgi:hypothetical protein